MIPIRSSLTLFRQTFVGTLLVISDVDDTRGLITSQDVEMWRIVHDYAAVYFDGYAPLPNFRWEWYDIPNGHACMIFGVDARMQRKIPFHNL